MAGEGARATDRGARSSEQAGGLGESLRRYSSASDSSYARPAGLMLRLPSAHELTKTRAYRQALAQKKTEATEKGEEVYPTSATPRLPPLSRACLPRRNATSANAQLCSDRRSEKRDGGSKRVAVRSFSGSLCTKQHTRDYLLFLSPPLLLSGSGSGAGAGSRSTSMSSVNAVIT